MNVEHTNVDYHCGDTGARGTWLCVHVKHDAAPRSGQTVSGYGAKIPTSRMLHVADRWRRVYAICYGNAASLYVVIKGQSYYISLL